MNNNNNNNNNTKSKGNAGAAATMATKPATQETLVLAFDIERSGGRAEHDTIQIGASVVNGYFKELDSFLVNGYIPKETVFEQKCWDEFWSKHKDVLSKTKYYGPKDKKGREREMIAAFQAFRRKWEEHSEKHGIKMEVVADNNVFDGGFINDMICRHRTEMPLPYDTFGKYKPFWETHSEQRGVLFIVDPDFKADWGFTKRIKELFDVPEMIKEHDHNAAHDAYTIAFEQQVLLNIRDGKIKLRDKMAVDSV